MKGQLLCQRRTVKMGGMIDSKTDLNSVMTCKVSMDYHKYAWCLEFRLVIYLIPQLVHTLSTLWTHTNRSCLKQYSTFQTAVILVSCGPTENNASFEAQFLEPKESNANALCPTTFHPSLLPLLSQPVPTNNTMTVLPTSVTCRGMTYNHLSTAVITIKLQWKILNKGNDAIITRNEMSACITLSLYQLYHECPPAVRQAVM